MTTPSYLPLAQASQLPTKELTPLIGQLLEAHQLGIRIAESYVISNATLTALLQKNDSVQQKMLTFYHTQLETDFVCIYYQTKQTHESLVIDNIVGDANFIETLFEIAQIKNDQAVLVQLTPQPLFSGLSWTRNQLNHSKQHIEIWSYLGAFPENSALSLEPSRYLADYRTGLVVEKNLNTAHNSWKRVSDGYEQSDAKLSQTELPLNALNQIIKATVELKRHFFSDQKIKWIVQDSQVHILYIEPVTALPDTNVGFQLISVGASLIPGYVQGKTFFTSEKKNTPGTSILVAETLSQNDLASIKNASGIIVEKSIKDHQVLTLISHFRIPTIINTHFAHKTIKPNQEVTLDATRGKVFVKHVTTKNSQVNQQPCRVFCLTSFPSQLINTHFSSTDGVVISSNQWYTLLKKHPLQLTKEDERAFLSMMDDELDMANKNFANNWFYFFSTLDSNARRKLSYGESYETWEANPGLGLRGTGYLLKHTSVLDRELTGLSYIYSKLKQTKSTFRMPLILPFVTAIEDALFLDQVIKEKQPNLEFDTWLHFHSVESILTLKHSTYWQPSGVVIDLDYLLSAWHGQDPQLPANQQTVSYAHSSLWPFLENILSNLDLPFKVICRQLSRNIMPSIITLKPETIITLPAHLTAARS